MEEKQFILVCARATDTHCAVLGTVTDRHCMTCGVEVMLAPAGQKFMQDNPQAKIRCLECAKQAEGADRLVREATPVPGLAEDLINDVIGRVIRSAAAKDN